MAFTAPELGEDWFAIGDVVRSPIEPGKRGIVLALPERGRYQILFEDQTLKTLSHRNLTLDTEFLSCQTQQPNYL